VAVFDQRLDRVAELAEHRAGDPRAFIDIMRELILEETRTPACSGCWVAEPWDSVAYAA
jgi:hypothetical protein